MIKYLIQPVMTSPALPSPLFSIGFVWDMSMLPLLFFPDSASSYCFFHPLCVGDVAGAVGLVLGVLGGKV